MQEAIDTELSESPIRMRIIRIRIGVVVTNQIKTDWSTS